MQPNYPMQPDALKLHFSQLAPLEYQNVYLWVSDTHIYYILYFRFDRQHDLNQICIETNLGNAK